LEYRRLGKNGLEISAISFGSWLTFGKQVENKMAEECMEVAYDNGINFFDNAEIYSKGESEIVMGAILKKKNWLRETYLVSSKVYWGGDLPNQKGLNRKHIITACEASLKRLQLDYLDLYFCHRPDINTPVEETVWTMHNLIQQGKVLYWGTSEWTAQEIQEAIMVARQNNLIPPAMEQPEYNMFTRRKMEVEYYKLLKDHGMGATIWSPLASGILTGKYNGADPTDTRFQIDGLGWLKDKNLTQNRLEKVEQLMQIALDLGTSVALLSLAWCLKNEFVTTAITGASKVSQLKENLKVFEIVKLLDDEVMERIEKVLDNKIEYPIY
jgi:voltage-dependent potassium channel beta subunit